MESGAGKNNLTAEKVDTCYLSQMVKVNIRSDTVILGACTLEMMCFEWCFT